MRIAGLEKTSFVDYPDKVAAVLFTPGCNMDCFYCHNRHLLGPDSPHDLHEPDAVLRFLEKRVGFLDGVVISGGEPTLQPDLLPFVAKIREMGFAIKLDTNGSRPWVVRSMVEADLVQFVAMDVKAPLARYEEIAGGTFEVDAIQESIDFLLAGRVDYEFRTTFAPQLSKIDIVTIATRIRGAKRYVLQQYRPPGLGTDMFGLLDSPPPRPSAYLRETAELVARFVEHCEIRGIDTHAEAMEVFPDTDIPAGNAVDLI